MDRFAAMLILLGLLVFLVLLVLSLFAVAPIICSCLVSLLYSLYLFMAYEESGMQHAQEFENRFWTIFAILLSTAFLFAKDSPIAFGLWYSPSLGFFCVLVSGYGMHLWDRHAHRIAISTSQQTTSFRLLRRSIGCTTGSNSINNTATMGGSGGIGPHGGSENSTISSSSTNDINSIHHHMTMNQSLLRLQDLGIPVSAQLERINSCLMEIDQLLIPSTINNFINQRFVLSKEREIISIFEECDARALNYLISHVKLGLLFYKIKDHNYFNGKNRTELINLLAVERLPILTVVSRVILLHSLQLLKLRANPRAEDWVRNILVNTHQDELSELKTLTDAKGDYFCMNKLIYDDIRSVSVRQDILNHIRREAAIQQTHMQMGTARRKKSKYSQVYESHWRKILSDVDDTLTSSGGMYPAGIDKRYPKKAVYPGVLAFYRELDLGPNGPEEWHEDRVGNLVFLSARPHVYRDMSEKRNFAKFESLRSSSGDGRKGMHTTPSLLAGDLSSGGQYLFTDDFEPLARKKFDNFRRYVSIYPEYQHVFVCDNGQGDVRSGEMMFDSFPYEFEACYVHLVQDIDKTYGYKPDLWRQKEFKPCFFRTYPEAALHAASKQKPPLISVKAIQRICQDAVKDFLHIKNWTSDSMKSARRYELNQAIWLCNDFLMWHLEEPVELLKHEQRWNIGQKVRTPYGIGFVCGYDPYFDMYDLELDWRPLDVQVQDHLEEVRTASIKPRGTAATPRPGPTSARAALATVDETTEVEEETDIVQVSIGRDALNQQQSLNPNSEVEDIGSVSTVTTEGTQLQEVGEPSAERPQIENSSQLQLPCPVEAATNTMPLQRSDPDYSTHSSFPTQNEDSSSDPTHDGSTRIRRCIVRNARYRVKAQVRGQLISKFTPPVLPKLEHRNSRSLFPFLTAKKPDSLNTTTKKSLYKAGEKWSTPYGLAKVVEHREKQGIVVVDMIEWNARAYLKPDLLKRTSTSLLTTILRQLSTGGHEAEKKPILEFPYAEGTAILTPFGKGIIVRPLSVPSKAKHESKSRLSTIGISLTSWTLSNGKHPTLYTTVETAKRWRESKVIERGSIFSTLETLVSSSRTLLEPFLVPKHQPIEVPPTKALFKQYYKDAAAVTTPYGEGRVVNFRGSDGLYEISLTRWKLTGGLHPRAFLRKEDLSHHISKGCLEGYPVLTSLGLTGRLASVEPNTGVHIVTIPSAGIVCYLQPASVLRPLKAAVNEEVLTYFGNGKVIRYNASTDMYKIALLWGAILYAKGDTFDRVGDGIPDEEARFGVNWLLSFFFFRSSSDTGSATVVSRSRSNSIVSATSRSIT